MYNMDNVVYMVYFTTFYSVDAFIKEKGIIEKRERNLVTFIGEKYKPFKICISCLNIFHAHCKC